jgi:ADP-ribose pyrophosphatase YjhB (NUDIX family)
MAFPGGRHDHVLDRSLLDTALRESREEVGLDPTHVDIVGVLPERRTLSSQYVVSPFVAQIPEPYEFIAEPTEVARVVDAPLAAFRDPAKRRGYEWSYRGRCLVVPSVLVAGETVWGLSLAIIDDLLASDLIDRL